MADHSTATRPPIPVSVLVGFLGSGKTTLLNYLLTATHGRRIAVVVNEFGAIAIDARLVRHTTERLIELNNGCICCTLRGDLLDEVRDLARLPDLDYILIEATGIAEPLPIAQTFHMEDLPALVRLDSIIAVVDAAAFWDHYADDGPGEDGAGNASQEPLAPLLADQIEFATIVVLNKADLVDAVDLEGVATFTRELNPLARIEVCARGAVDPARLLDTRLYDYDEAETHADWAAEWAAPTSEDDEYGFHSFVYRSEAPLVWTAFEDVLQTAWPPSVLRAKGIVTFTDHDPVLVSHAGTAIGLETLQAPDSEEGDMAAPSPLGDEDEVLTTELVFIGRGMPSATIIAALDACRLPSATGASLATGERMSDGSG